MPKGTFLSDQEKIQIKFFRDQGCSNREIARKIGRSECVIRNFIKKGQKYGIRKPTKGNKKLTRRQFNLIKQEATRNKLNATQIKNKLSLPVTSKHVAHILRTDGNIKWKKPKCKPMLKNHHKENRLKFARKYMKWGDEWKRVIFSDEKKFNLDGPDSYSCYWHDLRSNDVRMSKRNFGGGSVMVWAAFSAAGKSKICFVPTKMNSQIYNKLLEDALIPFMDEKMEEDCIFQQDNAAIHVSKQSKAWFNEHSIPLLDWPACSPDLNPMENLWGYMARKVYANNAQNESIMTVAELKLKIKQVWEEIDADLLKKLVESMPDRIFEVIHNKGSSTHY
ncbi:Transposable element Tc3 transposase [Lucilia cuprina]|nr:Transposable element Tc3 transposase [Lucilia cuprina]